MQCSIILGSWQSSFIVESKLTEHWEICIASKKGLIGSRRDLTLKISGIFVRDTCYHEIMFSSFPITMHRVFWPIRQTSIITCRYEIVQSMYFRLSGTVRASSAYEILAIFQSRELWTSLTSFHLKIAWNDIAVYGLILINDV